MSDKAEKHEKPAPAEAAAEAPAKKSPVKTIGIVAALMIGEAVGVYMVMNATGPKPAEATDVHLEGADEHDTELTVQLPLMEEKFQNMQTGRVWWWDTEVFLKVKAKNEEYVAAQLESARRRSRKASP